MLHLVLLVRSLETEAATLTILCVMDRAGGGGGTGGGKDIGVVAAVLVSDRDSADENNSIPDQFAYFISDFLCSTVEVMA